MKKSELKTDTHYWIKDESAYVNKEKAVYRNVNGCWVLTIGDSPKFLSDYKMELLFGRNFALREVDFEKDVIVLSSGGIPEALLNKETGAEKFVELMTTVGQKHIVQIPLKGDSGGMIVANYSPRTNLVDFAYGSVEKPFEEILQETGFLFFNEAI